MYRTDADGAVALKPARPAAVDPVGYFANGTVVDYGFLNDLMDEVCYAILAQGYALDRADSQQLADAIRAGIKSHNDPLSIQSTDHTLALIVSASCATNGSYCAVLGSQASTAGDGSSEACLVAMSETSTALGSRVAILASIASTVAASTATNAAIIASNDVDVLSNGADVAIIAALTCSVSAGNTSAVIASEKVSTSTCLHTLVGGCDSTGATTNDLAGTNAVVLLASDECDLTSTTLTFVAASTGATLSASQQSALLATKDSGASTGSVRGVLLATTECNLDSGSSLDTNFVIMASSGVDQSDFAVASSARRDYCVAGGVGTPKWRIDSNDGTFYGSAAFQSSGADFAEVFENALPGEIPAGTLLARVEDRVFPARPGDRVIGVVSTHPAVLGNATMEALDPARNTKVGLTGRLVVSVALDVVADDFLAPGPNGVAVKSPTETRIEVMKLLTPGVALCLVR